MERGGDDRSDRTVLESIRDAATAMSVRRVFGEPIVLDGVTLVPVARVSGGAAGGGGGGRSSEEESGGGFGSMFGLGVHPVGVYEVRDGRVEWRRCIDVDRLLRGARVVAVVATVCATLLRLQRVRRADTSRPREE